MLAQKRPRPLPSPASPGPDAHVVEAPGADAGGSGGGARRSSPKLAVNGAEERGGGPRQATGRHHDSDADDDEEEGGGGGDDSDSQSLQSDGEMDEFVLVQLMDVREEVQCPICLGILRKTRTVMECMHRFCRECIDKSMRLGNNECPSCRAHCPSRRALRDDPNFDALILSLYPDIDKYEQEELSFGEEEIIRNKKIQDAIAETYRRQSAALAKKRSTAKAIYAACTSNNRRNMRSRRRGRISSPDIVPTDFEDEDREVNGNDVDDRSPDVRPKRARRWPMPRRSPAMTIGSIDDIIEDNDDLVTASPLRGEMLAWGKNGTRSQNRHGNASGSSVRMARGGRLAKLVDQLRIAEDFDSKSSLYLVLLPLGQSVPKLEKPYLSCHPTLSVQHLCQFVALQLSRQPKEVEIYIRKSSMDASSMDAFLSANNTCKDRIKFDQSNGLERLWEEKPLSELYPSLTTCQGDLELLYSLKPQGQV